MGLKTQAATPRLIPVDQWVLFAPMETRLTSNQITQRLELVFSILKSLKEQGTKPGDQNDLDKQKVEALIKTRDGELTRQGFSWNMDFNFFFKLLDKMGHGSHVYTTVFFLELIYDIFNRLAEIHKVDPTMSSPIFNKRPVDIFEETVNQELQGRLSYEITHGLVKFAKKVFGVIEN